MITIIMPAYNCDKYIADAVRSVKEQTFKDWELYIIDDCSTDNTKAVAESLAADDKRIKVLRNDWNSGVSKTRNKGIKIADSDYIAFLDSDDAWEPDKLEKQVRLAVGNPQAGLIFTGSGFMNEDGERLEYILHVPERISRKELLKQNVISCSSVLVKKELITKHLMPETGIMHEDFASWLGILKDEKFAYGIDEPLLIYRISSSSKSGNKIKAAGMNWRTYRHAGLNIFQSVYYMGWYIVRGLMKYRHLK